MKELRVLFLFLILLSFSNCAEFQYTSGSNNACLKEIIVKWEVVDSYNSLNIKKPIGKIIEHEPEPEPESEQQIWIFTEDGVLNIGSTSAQYELQDYCRGLKIETGERTIVLEILLENGNMSLTAYESGKTLKKIN